MTISTVSPRAGAVNYSTVRLRPYNKTCYHCCKFQDNPIPLCYPICKPYIYNNHTHSKLVNSTHKIAIGTLITALLITTSCVSQNNIINESPTPSVKKTDVVIETQTATPTSEPSPTPTAKPPDVLFKYSSGIQTLNQFLKLLKIIRIISIIKKDMIN